MPADGAAPASSLSRLCAAAEPGGDFSALRTCSGSFSLSPGGGDDAVAVARRVSFNPARPSAATPPPPGTDDDEPAAEADAAGGGAEEPDVLVSEEMSPRSGRERVAEVEWMDENRNAVCFRRGEPGTVAYSVNGDARGSSGKLKWNGKALLTLPGCGTCLILPAADERGGRAVIVAALAHLADRAGAEHNLHAHLAPSPGSPAADAAAPGAAHYDPEVAAVAPAAAPTK